MRTYQVRPRYFRASDGEISFPTEVTLRIRFKPFQPFGVDTGESRTACQQSDNQLRFDANTGRTWVEPDELFDPLDLRFTSEVFEVGVSGNEMSVTFDCPRPAFMQRVARNLYFAIPVLLNIEYVDPPYPVTVEGEADGVPLSWELGEARSEFGFTTRELQEQRFKKAWGRFELLQADENRRLLAAARYLYTACRLERAGNSPWEFMGEIILNLCKLLEVLFPGPEGSESRDAAREGLRQVGVDEDQMERDFIPVLLLRDHIDSGHVLLSVFEQEHLEVLHRYCDKAIPKFRTLCDDVFEAVQEGEWEPKAYRDPTPRQDALDIIECMAANQADG